MTVNRVPIGGLVQPIASSIPAASAVNETFTYIDLSSVDQARKEIQQPATLPVAEAPSRARQLVKAGDVLVSTVRPNLNGVAVVPLDLDGATASTGFCVLRVDAQLDSRYLFQWVRSPEFVDDMVSKATGASYPAVSDRLIKSSAIPLPSLAEQRRIAEVLDRADALRAKRHQSRTLCEDLTQSIFLDLFGPARERSGWPIATLGELLAGIDSGKSPVCLSRPALDAEWGVLKLGAVSRQHYLPEQNKALPEDVEPAVADEVRAGDLLMARKNTLDLVGACALVGSTRPRLLLPDLIFRLRLHNQAPVELRYLHRTLGQDDVRGQIRSLAGGSAGSMPNISKARLSTVRVLTPPLELQKAFGARMELVEQQKNWKSSASGQLDALFASLQQRAFQGEL